MRTLIHVAWSVMIIGLISGCRAATRVKDVPRVDLQLGGGNRGYLVGIPPEPTPLKPTRQMVETDVEIPSFYKPKRSGAPVSVEETAPPEVEVSSERATSGAFRYDTYVVQRGDSLWSIAAKPEIYGKATRWRQIFEANRDLLKSPDRLRAGLTLKIPRSEEGESNTTYSDEGITYKK